MGPSLGGYPETCPGLPEIGLIDQFESWAARQPAKPALFDTGTVLTYAELDSASNRMAHAITRLDASSDLPIGVFIGQGAAFVTAVLAVLKAGHFFVPLDPSAPISRNREILRDAGLEWLLATTSTVGVAEETAAGCCRVIDVDERSAGMSSGPVSVVRDAAGRLGYLLYTSGSTGRPKGVLQDLESIFHNMRRHAHAFSIEPTDRISLLYECNVYGAIRDIFNALLNGASLHVYRIRRAGTQRLAAWLREQEVTIYSSVATVFRQLAATLTPMDSFPRVRVVKLGGEATTRADVEHWRRYFPTTGLLHCGLGSTETGMICEFPITQATEVQGLLIPLGRPLAGLDVRLLDGAGRQVRAGEVGEIVVRSRYIARRYWRSPELANPVLSPDPQDADVRLYRSGDLARDMGGGCLEHQGRKDCLVKIRGNRVDLGEIEAHLLRIASVSEAAVVDRRDVSDAIRLAAYVVAHDASLNARRIHDILAADLPAYMLPNTVTFLESLPQTQSGKLNRRMLRELPAELARRSSIYQPPASPVAGALVRIWEQLLGHEPIGIDDNYFELGGDSLTAVKITQRIELEFAQNISLATLLKAPTIAELEKIVSGEIPHPDWSPLVTLKSLGSKAPFFMIHPGGGNVLGYKEFADLLHVDQPVYAMQAYGVVKGQEPQSDLVQMARCYLEHIQRIQPSGPYRLGGESFGGLVAYEMACQLQDSGKEVSFLFLGDAWSTNVPGYDPWRYTLSRAAYVGRLVALQWCSLLTERLRGRSSCASPVKRYVFADELHRKNSAAHRRAAEHFVPRPFIGKVTLFRAARRHHAVKMLEYYFGSAAMGWPRLAADGVDVHWIDDTHREMMHGDNAAPFAELLQRLLDEAG